MTDVGHFVPRISVNCFKQGRTVYYYYRWR